MSAWINGFSGLIASFLIGTFYLRIGPWQSLRCVVASNLGGLAALWIAVVWGNKPWIRKHIMPNPFRTWAIFLLVYFGILAGLSSPLWSAHEFLWMAVPLILSTGFTILAFGPLQDARIARAQILAQTRRKRT